MLNNNKKIFIYNLCFGLSKLYTNIQQDQKAKLDVVYLYGRQGEGWGLEALKCFVGGGQNFFYLLCVCGGGGGGRGSGSVPLLP